MNTESNMGHSNPSLVKNSFFKNWVSRNWFAFILLTLFACGTSDDGFFGGNGSGNSGGVSPKCSPSPVPGCTSTAPLVLDPVAAAKLLRGTWIWQSAFHITSSNDNGSTGPSPDSCNAVLVIDENLIYQLAFGKGQIVKGSILFDTEDITLSNQFALANGGPNLVHEFKMHVTFTPEPLNFTSSMKYATTLSNLIGIGNDGACLELYHLATDLKGVNYRYGNRFIKNE